MTDTILINFLLDDSGSMQQIRDAVIEGFNEFLVAQKAVEGDAYFTFATFSHPGSFEIITKEQPIADVPDLHADTYNPNGHSTALYDAMAEYIEKTQVMAATRELQDGKKPRVLFITMTDGLNNTGSTSKDTVFEEVKKRTEENEWQFVYLGANQDAYAASGQMGVAKGSTQGYAATAGGTKAAFRSLATNTTSYRAGGQSVVADFFVEEINSEDEDDDVDNS